MGGIRSYFWVSYFPIPKNMYQEEPEAIPIRRKKYLEFYLSPIELLADNKTPKTYGTYQKNLTSYCGHNLHLTADMYSFHFVKILVYMELNKCV